MFDPTSRYAGLSTARTTLPDGRVVSYVRRRFLPQAESLPVLAEVVVMQGDRMDVITARVLRDPEQFWRLCDANGAMDPWELVRTPGRRLRVPGASFR